VAISWEENWHWALEDTSRQCFGEGNIQGMIETLTPLHEMVEKPITVREVGLPHLHFDCNLHFHLVLGH
jgi:serine/threonine-protein kinase mTOR